MIFNPDQKVTRINNLVENSNKPIDRDIEAIRAIARDLTTTPEILRELADSRDRSIREGVAANPNAPIDILWELGAKFPQQLLKNPTFERLIQENSVFLKKMPFKTASVLFFEPATPDQLREKLLNYHPNLIDC